MTKRADEGRRHDVPSIKQAAWSRRIVNRRRDAVSCSMEMAFAVKFIPASTRRRCNARSAASSNGMSNCDPYLYLTWMVSAWRVLPVKRFQVESYDMPGRHGIRCIARSAKTVDAGFLPSGPLIRLRTYRIAGEAQSFPLFRACITLYRTAGSVKCVSRSDGCVPGGRRSCVGGDSPNVRRLCRLGKMNSFPVRSFGGGTRVLDQPTGKP